MKSSSSRTILLFLLMAIGFALVALDLRDKQRQIDALQRVRGGASHGSRIEDAASNEQAAAAALRNLVSAEAMFQQAGRADEDEDSYESARMAAFALADVRARRRCQVGHARRGRVP